MNTQAKIKKESKRKIKADFERAPLSERLKAKYLNSFFYKKLLVAVFRFVLLLGISYVILYPFASKILQSVFSPSDLIQTDVLLVSKNPTIDTYKYLITENGYSADQIIKNISRIDPSKRFIPGKTLLFFDEIQNGSEWARAISTPRFTCSANASIFQVR